jgi:hypothetical protein
MPSLQVNSLLSYKPCTFNILDKRRMRRKMSRKRRKRMDKARDLLDASWSRLI